MKIKKATLLCMLFFGIFISSSSLLISQNHIPTKSKDIKSLNNSIVYNLFLNFDISEQNNKLKHLSYYYPHSVDKSDVESVLLKAEHNDATEEVEFLYNKNNLVKLNYKLSSNNDRTRKTSYDFQYDDGNLSEIKIGKTKRIVFEYDALGKIKTIKKYKNRMWHKYHISYSKKSSKAHIVYEVQRGVKKKRSDNKYFVEWNDKFNITGFNINNYSTSNISYNNIGVIDYHEYVTASRDSSYIDWSYTTDKEDNWVTKKSKNTTYTRSIKYD